MAGKPALCLFVLVVSILLVHPVRAEVNVAIAASVSTTGISVTDSYNLRMTAEDPSCPMPEGNRGGTFDLSLEGASSGAFSGMSFTEPGDYSYTITQLPGSHPLAVFYDETVYHLRIQAVDRGSGELQITAIMNREGSQKKVGSADFTNEYIPPAVSHNPPVNKTVTGDTPASPSAFKFSMKAVSNTAGLTEMPMPEGSSGGKKTISTTPGTEKEFGEMQFGTPGTYVYEIAEVDDGKEGYSYDDGVYTLTYTVERKDREMTCSLAVTKDGKQVDKAVFAFTNTYKEEKKKKDEGGGSSSHRSGGGSSGGSSGSSGSSAGGAQTGDETPVMFWVIVVLAAALGLAGLIGLLLRRSK